MGISRVGRKAADAVNVTVTDDALTAELSDGRTISVPLAWYPRLLSATPKERANWRLIGKGQPRFTTAVFRGTTLFMEVDTESG